MEAGRCIVKIAHLANFYGPTSGGLRTAMHALGQGYLDQGHDVLLVVPGAKDADETTAWGRRISIKSPLIPGTGGYRVIMGRRAVRKALRDFAPDVVEVSDRTTLRWVGAWAKRQRIPSVFFAHERADGILHANLPGWIARPRTVRAAADWHNRGTASRFAAIVCTTDYAREEFDRAGLAAVTIPLGVDLDRFHPRNRHPEVISQHASAGERVLLMASRLSTEKRPDLAIDAVRLLSERGNRVHLISAGSGNQARAMATRAEGLPVTFLGFVTDREYFSQLLATADAVVAPGPIETFGLAALEALASGTPVVVNAASALPQVVAGAGVAAEGTPQAFADAIEALLARPESKRRADARNRAETMPWSATVSAMLRLHRQLLHHLNADGGADPAPPAHDVDSPAATLP